MLRLGLPVDYITVLGDDAWSDEMLSAWQAEGVATGSVIRSKGRLPGRTSSRRMRAASAAFLTGEMRAPARDLFALPETPSVCSALARFGHIYLSGISLSLYGPDGRAVLFDALANAQKTGSKIVFDNQLPPPRLARSRGGAGCLR